MANAPITGLLASITFATGYTTNGYAWIADLGAVPIDNTPFTPPDDYRTRDTETPLKSWGGRYRCHYPVSAATNITGPAYVAYPYTYNLRITCEALEVTKFTDAWRDYIGGILDASGNYEAYLDTTTPLPTAGTTASGIFTLGTGVTYTVPLMIGETAEVSISADGSQRAFRAPFVSTGAVSTAGTPPVPGVTGAATFTANTSRTFGGTILVTAVDINMTAGRDTGDITLEFVGQGTCTPA